MEEVTTITQVPVPAVKKTRKSRAKVTADTVGPGPRTLSELTNVAFSKMTPAELVLVASSLSAEYQDLSEKYTGVTQQVGILKRQNNKMLATMAYIKQTMEHANTSISLQIGTCDD